MVKKAPQEGSWEAFTQQVKEMDDNRNLHYAASAIMNWLTWKGAGSAWILTSGHQNVIHTNIKELTEKQEEIFNLFTGAYNCRWIEKEMGSEGLVFATVPHDPNVFDPYKEALIQRVQKLKDAGFMIGAVSTRLDGGGAMEADADYAIDVWDYPKGANHGQRSILVNPEKKGDEVVVTRLYFMME